MASEIKFYLNVCDDRSEAVVGGKSFTAGHRGEIELGHRIENDVLYMDLETCGHKPYVGDAKDIEAVSIRICAKTVTTIAMYKDQKMSLLGCCHCCDNGCCVYGSSGCGCG